MSEIKKERKKKYFLSTSWLYSKIYIGYATKYSYKDLHVFTNYDVRSFSVHKSYLMVVNFLHFLGFIYKLNGSYFFLYNIYI